VCWVVVQLPLVRELQWRGQQRHSLSRSIQSLRASTSANTNASTSTAAQAGLCQVAKPAKPKGSQGRLGAGGGQGD
jgi:hypothetical protein